MEKPFSNRFNYQNLFTRMKFSKKKRIISTQNLLALEMILKSNSKVILNIFTLWENNTELNENILRHIMLNQRWRLSLYDEYDIELLTTDKNYFVFYSPLLSPCSPMIYPWQLLGAISNLWDSKNLNLDESKLVPLPITLFLGNPLIFHATYVKMSTGLLTTIKIVSGEYFTSFGIMDLNISVFLCTKFSLDSPSLCLAPAVMMHILELAVLA